MQRWSREPLLIMAGDTLDHTAHIVSHQPCITPMLVNPRHAHHIPCHTGSCHASALPYRALLHKSATPLCQLALLCHTSASARFTEHSYASVCHAFELACLTRSRLCISPPYLPTALGKWAITALGHGYIFSSYASKYIWPLSDQCCPVLPRRLGHCAWPCLHVSSTPQSW